MEEFEKLIEVLETSAERNGKDKPLTIGHLLNICKMVERNLQREEIKRDMLADYLDLKDNF